jgi:hypothetical protein
MVALTASGVNRAHTVLSIAGAYGLPIDRLEVTDDDRPVQVTVSDSDAFDGWLRRLDLDHIEVQDEPAPGQVATIVAPLRGLSGVSITVEITYYPTGGAS